ncbi:O-phosphoseryl-tRNA(Sec) selenium transferase [Thelohanellus kitauei]|uniref:O-phosphoseryl-tRNA(Sec) selenium transferase n=1 Tax=Thelohanellus kitauei TaxID=669202 RepID=A0A0C2JKL6_THEKT|nr:O-phosphoseryl-tRNA(Sec) selenium transferase [Thelohanellus kitauei]
MQIDPDLIENSYLRVISSQLIQHANQGASQTKNCLETLLRHGKISKEGMDVKFIRLVLYSLSSLDSNNFLKNCPMGEREGHVFSSIVADKCFGFSHGIGRSGDLFEVQPKAVGSSILYQLTNKLAFHALQLSKITNIEGCLVVPLATGMSLSLCMRSLATAREGSKYVIWSRIDQKSCFKSILNAGLEPVVIQNVLDGDAVKTDIEGIRRAIEAKGPQNIVCVMSTTSCFAPRYPDDILKVGDICKEFGVPHLLNNAYGVQVSKYCNIINETLMKSRLDLIVQSTDKNFMVPVGGSIIASPCPGLLKKVSATYAGILRLKIIWTIPAIFDMTFDDFIN